MRKMSVICAHVPRACCWGRQCGCVQVDACAHHPVGVTDAVHGHLDANGNLGVVRAKGRNLVLRKGGGRGARAKLVAANLGDHLVVGHGHHVDHHGERAKVTALAVPHRVALVRVGTEGREEAEEGQHPGGVQEGKGHAHDEDASLRDRPVDKPRRDLGSRITRSVGVRVWLGETKVVVEGTRSGLLIGSTLVHHLLSC